MATMNQGVYCDNAFHSECSQVYTWSTHYSLQFPNNNIVDVLLGFQDMSHCVFLEWLSLNSIGYSVF